MKVAVAIPAFEAAYSVGAVVEQCRAHIDRILVIEGGIVTESGRHDDLLRRDGRYAAFYRLQLRDEEQAAAPES